MAIIDKFLELSSAQAITVTAPSTNVIDAGATKSASLGRDIGSGKQLFLEVNITTSMAGSGTLTIALQDSADNSTFADVLELPAIAVAALTAGKTYYVPLPAGLRRYIRANYTITSGPFTAGALQASIVDGWNFIKSQPDGLTKVV
ncbi:MAG: Bbp16 family capsid cement protein [Pseudomonas sp.]